MPFRIISILIYIYEYIFLSISKPGTVDIGKYVVKSLIHTLYCIRYYIINVGAIIHKVVKISVEKYEINYKIVYLNNKADTN